MLDHIQRGYDDAADGWANGAEIVYGPLAQSLVDESPVALDGAVVVDVGAGTGAASAALLAAGARPLAFDAVVGMLAHHRAVRPPCAVADVMRLPLRAASVDGAAAAFVLNHLEAPIEGLRELARVVRPGGVVLASVFSERDRFPAKTQIDVVAQELGWTPPDWYQRVKQVDGLLGSAASMTEAAGRVGLFEVEVFEGAIDIGVQEPADIVRYRLAQPQLAGFVATLDPDGRRQFFDAAVDAVTADGSPLEPGVVFLAATVPR